MSNMNPEEESEDMYVSGVRFLGVVPMTIKYQAKGYDDAVEHWKHSFWYKVLWIKKKEQE